MAVAPANDTCARAAGGVAEIRSRALVDAMPGSILGANVPGKPDPLASTPNDLHGSKTDRTYGALHCSHDTVPLGPSGPPAVVPSRAVPPVVQPLRPRLGNMCRDRSLSLCRSSHRPGPADLPHGDAGGFHRSALRALRADGFVPVALRGPAGDLRDPGTPHPPGRRPGRPVRSTTPDGRLRASGRGELLRACLRSRTCAASGIGVPGDGGGDTVLPGCQRGRAEPGPGR